MTHLNPDELIDAMEGLLTPERQAHLALCDHCQRELADLSSVLSDVKLVSVPEPSPLFWQHFSERVRTAIAEGGVGRGHWLSWLRWRLVLPVGAVALTVLALSVSAPEPDTELPEVAVEVVAPPIEDSWTMVANLVGELNLETATEAGIPVTPGLAERAMLELTADERQELTRLLKAELARAKS